MKIYVRHLVVNAKFYNSFVASYEYTSCEYKKYAKFTFLQNPTVFVFKLSILCWCAVVMIEKYGISLDFSNTCKNPPNVYCKQEYRYELFKIRTFIVLTQKGHFCSKRIIQPYLDHKQTNGLVEGTFHFPCMQ